MITNKNKIDDSREISKLQNELKRLKQTSYRSPFTSMLTVMCYMLWQDYKFSRTKLADFINKFMVYDHDYDEQEITKLHDDLMEYADWTIDYSPYSMMDMPQTKSAVARAYYKKIVEYNNTINSLCTRYITYGFCVLKDDDWKPRKLTNAKDHFNHRLAFADDEHGIMGYWHDLVNEVGICIERPKIDT